MTRLTLLITFILLTLGIPFSANSVVTSQGDVTERPKLRTASYDGKWGGTIKCLYDPGLWPGDECDIGLNFRIDGDSFLVEQTIRNKKTGESKKYEVNTRFQFMRLATNAIAISLNSGDDEDGTWVETWSFVMTLKDPDHMIVHWTRVVNNIDMPKNMSGSKFSSVGMGELVREDETP